MFCYIFIQIGGEFRGEQLELFPVKWHSANTLIDVFVIFWTEGEIQGTVHRRLLEEREEELKAGAVLLLKQVGLTASSSTFSAMMKPALKFFSLNWMYCGLKSMVLWPLSIVSLCGQVGVFSPSHRNHYLNVTPNNLLRIYTPDGASLSSAQLPPLVLVSAMTASRRQE